MRKLAACSILLSVTACAPAAPAPAHEAEPTPRAPSSVASAAKTEPSAPAASSAPAPAAGAPQSAESAEPAPQTIALGFECVLDEPVRAMALEHDPFAAALGDGAVHLHDAHGWRTEKLPSGLPAASAMDLSIFYGRDDRVRLIGTRTDHGGPEGIYFRWLPAGFKKERGEIGKLSAPRGALVAVLGTADPEIVCRPGDVCLVKRRSGWTTIAAPADIARVVLGEGVGWAIAGKKLLRLGESGWESAGPEGSWAEADALFATRDRAWVVETKAARIHAFSSSQWHVEPAPIQRPRSLWGTAADALWLAGDGGLAFFDGTAWRRAAAAPAPLAVVSGRGRDDVWIGGAHGLCRVEQPPAH